MFESVVDDSETAKAEVSAAGLLQSLEAVSISTCGKFTYN